MAIEDYQGHTRTSRSQNSPSTNDQDPEGCFSGPSDSTQICKALGQEGSNRFFCATGIRINTRSRQYQGHQVLTTYFQKLSKRAISPHQATPGSVSYDLFTPIDFTIQPREQKTVFTDFE